MMKKIALTMLTILSCGMAYALPLGNPAEASLMCDGVFCEGWCGDPCDPCASWCDMWSVRIGFYGDYNFNRNLEVDGNDSDIRDTEIFTNAGYLAVNVWNRVDIFATLGTTQIDIATPGGTFGLAVNDMAYLHFDTNFSWSVGARGTLWQCGCLAFGLEGQYFQTRPEFDCWRQEGEPPIYFNGSNHVRYSDWQIGLGAAYRISIGACSATALVPYVGVKWSGARFRGLDGFEIPSGTATPLAILRDLENKKRWGWAIGVSLLGCDKALLTVEGRFADEKAVYVNGEFRF